MEFQLKGKSEMHRYSKLVHWMAALSLGTASMLAVQNAPAQESANAAASETQGDLVIFPGGFGALVSDDSRDPTAGQPGSKAGWHIPGNGYRAGTGWWALVCFSDDSPGDEHSGCRLYDTSLSVARAKHGVYDSEPVNSQLLHWSPLPFDLDKVEKEGEKRPTLIAVFKPLRSLAKLKLAAGPVSTYVHQGMGAYPATQRPGTLEVRLALGNGQFADVVPRVQLNATKDGNRNAPASADIATFELRIGRTRQQLPGFSFNEIAGTGLLRPQGYLMWAGDLDGDGKPDLILRHSDYSSDVSVYLSTLAKPGELVGLAGRFQYSDPSSAGC